MHVWRISKENGVLLNYLRGQDAPEPHNGVSDVEYLERFPYNPIH